jgi:aldose 1-epimerase
VPHGSHRALPVLVLAAALLLVGSALAVARGNRHAKHARLSVTSVPWGSVGSQPVRLYSLSNGHMKVKITNYGGVIQSIDAPDRHGRLADVALGFSSLKGYLNNDVYPQPSGGSGTTYFGATIGRYANRIAHGTFTLDGQTYHVPINNGENALHGGPVGWNDRVWTPTVIKNGKQVGLSLTYTSPDMEEGFPGAVVATVTFTLDRFNDLRIQYHATTDKPTVINMTNHSYFNLAGQASGSILAQKLMINANRYTPTNANQIPTGQQLPVRGTPMNFLKMKPIGRDITKNYQQLILAHGYDHNWDINGKDGTLRLAARAIDPASGRELTAYTTQPGVQVYTGNFLVGDLVGTTGRTYRQSAAFTLETQHLPDSPNQPSFPSTTLNPGTPFNSTTVFTFSTARR